MLLQVILMPSYVLFSVLFTNLKISHSDIEEENNKPYPREWKLKMKQYLEVLKEGLTILAWIFYNEIYFNYKLPLPKSCYIFILDYI